MRTTSEQTLPIGAIEHKQIFQVRKSASRESVTDDIAVEAPLQITITYEREGTHARQIFATTMRTPGHDRELVTGFLFAEGVIKNAADIVEVVQNEHAVEVLLASHVEFNAEQTKRYSTVTSSCGVCGKVSLENLATNVVAQYMRVDENILFKLPDLLRESQKTFNSTGGLHAVGLFSNTTLIRSFEDVGRHNAMDKLVGSCLREGLIPLTNHIVVLSGRASYELIQKASAAGVALVASVGAPSSMAIETAERSGITLIGFLNQQRFNIYTHPYRVVENRS